MAAARKKAPAKKRAPAKRGRKAKGNVITIDFTDVESGGGIPTPDGYYTASIKHIEQEVGGDSGEPYLAIRWKTSLGSTVFDNFSLQPQSLWVLRTMLECAGYEIPDDEYELDIDGMEGLEVGLEVINEDYEEQPRPRVTGYMPLDAVESMGGAPAAVEAEEEEEEPEEEEEEEEEPTPPKKKAAAKKKAPAKKKAALRPGARVTFEGEDGEDVPGVIEYVEEDMATVVDDEEGEWEIPVAELTKA